MVGGGSRAKSYRALRIIIVDLDRSGSTENSVSPADTRPLHDRWLRPFILCTHVRIYMYTRAYALRALHICMSHLCVYEGIKVLNGADEAGRSFCCRRQSVRVMLPIVPFAFVDLCCIARCPPRCPPPPPTAADPLAVAVELLNMRRIKT